jgi:hypothetical protein
MLGHERPWLKVHFCNNGLFTPQNCNGLEKQLLQVQVSCDGDLSSSRAPTLA